MMTQRSNPTLSSLFADIVSAAASLPAVPITHLCSDSRHVQHGSLFLAYPGYSSDGRDFIKQAIAQGAVAVAVEANDWQASEAAVPIVPVQNLQTHLSAIASAFYDHPSRALKVVGVTGTNGKTSITHFIARSLSALGEPCGVMGTLGNGVYGHLSPATHTTQDAIACQAQLAKFRDENISYVAMEVSSHGLDQRRVAALQFDSAIFTNLTRDHLDYHGTMEAYGAAKLRLFQEFALKAAVINADDVFSETIRHALYPGARAWDYSLNHQGTSQAALRLTALRRIATGFGIQLVTPWGKGQIKIPLFGKFNIQNVLAVIGILSHWGIAWPDIVTPIQALSSVEGRMQHFQRGQSPQVIVDYAHTPDALIQVLTALRPHCQGQLWCVFGCGGDRDPGKRPVMAAAVEQYADKTVVTDDNPRHEDPAAIVCDMMQGFKQPARVIVEHDRRQAIAYAIQAATSHDIVLVAGKGHESYQQIGDTRFPYSDIMHVQFLLERYA